MMDAALIPIVIGLRTNTHMTYMATPKNRITDFGVSEYAQTLKNCAESAINHVNLSQNSLTAKSGQWLSEAIRNNLIIGKLDLSFNADFGDEGVSYLCEGLAENESLLRLRLGANDLTDACCEQLANVLARHCNLSTLELQNNPKITGEGIKLLSQGIRLNHHLKFLNLEGTTPQILGAKALQYSFVIVLSFKCVCLSVKRHNITSEKHFQFD